MELIAICFNCRLKTRLELLDVDLVEVREKGYLTSWNCTNCNAISQMILPKQTFYEVLDFIAERMEDEEGDF